MVIPDPYLPDIMEGIISRVDAAFASRENDPFNVLFEKGIYGQVSRSVYNRPWTNQVLAWLVMPFTERIGRDFSIWGELTCNIILAMPTDGTFSQQQRDDQSYKSRLIPVYDVLMQEIQREKWFSFAGPRRINHMRMIRPYWGGGDVNGVNSKNLFEKEVDAIGINDLALRVKRPQDMCNPASYPLNRNTQYPAPPSILVFHDDMELIVDGGRSTDPLTNATSVIIPALKGKKYTVFQRAFGQLLQQRSIEVADDAVNGGFSLLQGYKFSKDDAYIVKVHPSIVSDVSGLAGTLSKSVTSVFMESNS